MGETKQPSALAVNGRVSRANATKMEIDIGGVSVYKDVQQKVPVTVFSIR
jgi:hypothetical protein